MRLALIGMATLVLLPGCAPKAEAGPEPAPPPRVAPPAPAPPAPPPDWRDVPLTPGGWSYASEPGGSRASFALTSSEPAFVIRCDRPRSRVVLSRQGRTTGAALVLRTSYGARSLPISPEAEPLVHTSATIPSSDSLLDQIVFSRGRFTVEAPGLPTLILPAWPEAARVVEDCRI